MFSFIFTLLFLSSSIYCHSLNKHHSTSDQPTLIRTINIPKPGFVQFIPNQDLNSLKNVNDLKYHLMVSSFNGAPYSADFLFYYQNLTKSILANGTNLVYQTLNNKNLVWPNEVNYVTSSLFHNDSFDQYGGVLSAGGFLVPSKNNGKVLYYKFESEDRSTVTLDLGIDLTTNKASKTEWFYHRTRMVDINGDKIPDILTCRTYKPIFGTTKVQLVAFVFNVKTSDYDENVIKDNVCDVFFDVADLDNDGRVEIIAAGFFISQLNLIYSNNKDNNFLDTDNLVVTTLDTGAGKLFDIKVEDLDFDMDKENSDKTYLEMMVTNHQGTKDAVKGSLFYYKMVNGSNIRTGVWQRNLIYDTFPVLKTGIQQAAPGGAKTFLPFKDPKVNNQRPYIFISGDGGEKGYIFKPNQIGQPLAYDLIWTQMYSDTVGGASFVDLDNDGYTEFAVAIYEKNNVMVYSFKP